MPRLAANLMFLYTEAPFMERFALAASDGFRGVEYQLPYDFDKRDIRDELGAHGLEMVLINMPAGDWGAGDRGIACDPGRVKEFRESVDLTIEYARFLECPRVNCLSGLVPSDVSDELVEACLVENFAFAAARLGEHDIELLTEPINSRDMPGFCLSRSRHTLEIMDKVGSDNMRLQYDIYHMQIMEGDLAHSLEAHVDRIGHIQIADPPGRHEPGTGEINFPYLFDTLDRIGYAGWVGCEYAPSAATRESLAWAEPYLGRRDDAPQEHS